MTIFNAFRIPARCSCVSPPPDDVITPTPTPDCCDSVRVTAEVVITPAPAVEVDLTVTGACFGLFGLIYKSTNGGTYQLIGNLVGTTYTDTAVTVGNTYQYRIVFADEDQSCAPSTSNSVFVDMRCCNPILTPENPTQRLLYRNGSLPGTCAFDFRLTQQTCSLPIQWTVSLISAPPGTTLFTTFILANDPNPTVIITNAPCCPTFPATSYPVTIRCSWPGGFGCDAYSVDFTFRNQECVLALPAQTLAGTPTVTQLNSYPVASLLTTNNKTTWRVPGLAAYMRLIQSNACNDNMPVTVEVGFLPEAMFVTFDIPFGTSTDVINTTTNGLQYAIDFNATTDELTFTYIGAPVVVANVATPAFMQIQVAGLCTFDSTTFPVAPATSIPV